MGADMLGYFLYVPTKSSGKVLKKHITKVKKLFAPNSVRFIKDLAGEDRAESKKKILDELSEAGVSTYDYKNDLGFSSNDDEISEEQLEEILDAVRGDALVLSGEIDLDFRDLAVSDLTVNGCHVDVYFAGGMSWGDEPEGEGYEMLKKMVKVGVFSAFYNSIPWDKRKTKKGK